MKQKLKKQTEEEGHQEKDAQPRKRRRKVQVSNDEEAEPTAWADVNVKEEYGEEELEMQALEEYVEEPDDEKEDVDLYDFLKN